MKVDVLTDGEALAAALAHRVAEAARAAVTARGRFTLALAGGSTPIAAYALLGRGAPGARMPWDRTVLLWGDERCVTAEHPLSNFGAAMAALDSPPGLTPEAVHPIEGHLGAEAAAASYAEVLGRVVGPGPAPTLDLVLLGLGSDGHTASLFPGSPVLEVRHRAVAPVEAPSHIEPRVPRVTLTLPALAAAREVLFAVSGRDKAEVVGRVLGAGRGAPLPAAMVGRGAGATWLLDAAAAAALSAD
jgi:6-phosphogluconolactonase